MIVSTSPTIDIEHPIHVTTERVAMQSLSSDHICTLKSLYNLVFLIRSSLHLTMRHRHQKLKSLNTFEQKEQDKIEIIKTKRKSKAFI